MIIKNADLNWFRKQLQDRIGLTCSEAGELICSNMSFGRLIGHAPIATRLPKISARSHLLPGDGQKKDFQIPSELWKFIDIDWEEESPCFNFHDDHSSWIIPRIEIDRVSACSFLKSRESELQALHPAVTKFLNTGANRKGKGGRPKEHDWDKFLMAAEQWMQINGRPNTLAEFTRQMFKWFKTGEPSDSTVRSYLRKIYFESESGDKSD